eukprot:3256483-Amphidinium_carterae.1
MILLTDRCLPQDTQKARLSFEQKKMCFCIRHSIAPSSYVGLDQRFPYASGGADAQHRTTCRLHCL